MITVADLISLLQNNFDPDEFVACSVISKESVEDVINRLLTNDEWRSVGDDLVNELENATVNFDIWNTLEVEEDEEVI